MGELYNRIKGLCEAAGINVTTMCKASGASRGSLTDLKVGRKQSLSADTLSRIASYFNVSVDYLLGNTDTKKAPGVTVYDEDDNIIRLDDEAMDALERLRTQPGMKVLFSVTKGATKEDILKAVKIIEALKDNGGDFNE